ncbi:MAG: hypothetical protein GY722_24110 [bacterium]|nr:hypothetical protein [bacterium]
MSRKSCLLLLLSVFFAGCIVPLYYHVRFDDSGLDLIPRDYFAASVEVLALPCWRWSSSSSAGFGPPILVHGQDLGRLPEKTKTWRGVEAVDLFGHEGSRVPVSCGALLVGDDGGVVLLGEVYKSVYGGEGDFFWEIQLATTGPRIKTALREALASKAVSPQVLELVFGDTKYTNSPECKILGEPGALTEALRFVDGLGATGDDVWRPAPGEADNELR